MASDRRMRRATQNSLIIQGEVEPKLQENRLKGPLPLSGWCPTRGMFGYGSCWAYAKRLGHEGPGDKWDHLSDWYQGLSLLRHPRSEVVGSSDRKAGRGEVIIP